MFGWITAIGIGSAWLGLYLATDNFTKPPSIWVLKTQIRVPEALLNSATSWHDHHCDTSGGQPCLPISIRTVTERQYFDIFDRKYHNIAVQRTRVLIGDDPRFKMATTWKIADFSCCNDTAPYKDGGVIAESDDFVITIEKGWELDGKLRIACSSKRHCIAPPMVPFPSIVRVASRSNATWPDHYHFWLVEGPQLKGVMSEKEVAIWDKSELPWRPHTKYDVITTLKRLVTPLPVYRYTPIDLKRGYKTLGFDYPKDVTLVINEGDGAQVDDGLLRRLVNRIDTLEASLAVSNSNLSETNQRLNAESETTQRLIAEVTDYHASNDELIHTIQNKMEALEGSVDSLIETIPTINSQRDVEMVRQDIESIRLMFDEFRATTLPAYQPTDARVNVEAMFTPQNLARLVRALPFEDLDDSKRDAIIFPWTWKMQHDLIAAITAASSCEFDEASKERLSSLPADLVTRSELTEHYVTRETLKTELSTVSTASSSSRISKDIYGDLDWDEPSETLVLTHAQAVESFSTDSWVHSRLARVVGQLALGFSMLYPTTSPSEAVSNGRRLITTVLDAIEIQIKDSQQPNWEILENEDYTPMGSFVRRLSAESAESAAASALMDFELPYSQGLTSQMTAEVSQMLSDDHVSLTERLTTGRLSSLMFSIQAITISLGLTVQWNWTANTPTKVEYRQDGRHRWSKLLEQRAAGRSHLQQPEWVHFFATQVVVKVVGKRAVMRPCEPNETGTHVLGDILQSGHSLTEINFY